MLRVGLTGSIACGKSFIGKLFKVYGVRIVDSDVIAREVVLPHSPVLEEVAQKFGPDFILPDGNLNRPKMRETVFADKSKLALLNSIMHPAIRRRTDELCMLCERGEPFPDSYLNLCQPKQPKPAATASKTADATSASCTNGAASEGHSCTSGTASAGESCSSCDGAEAGQVVNESKTEAGIRALREPLDERYVLKDGQKPPYILVDIPLLFENKLESYVDRILVVDASRQTQIARILERDGCSLETAQNIIDKQLSREYKLQHADDVIQTDVLSIEEKRAHVLKLHLTYLDSAAKM